MYSHRPTIKERLLDFLFETKLGTIICAITCITLFCLMFGVGYLAFGLFVFYMSCKKNERNPKSWAASGIGVIFLWPIALAIVMLDDN
jgi:hypothetical protein